MSRRLVAVVIFVLSVMGLKAQYNTDRLLLSGQIAMDNSDYVVAIQHFNNIIASKPYLYRPWFYRGIAKELLGDFVGADNDLSKAIDLNPYVHQIFSGRAEVRINLKRYADAIADYDKALRLYPDDKGYWFNRAYAYYKNKEADSCRNQLQYIINRWPDFPNAYGLMTEIYLNANDTVNASRWLERTLKVNPYDGNLWSIVGRLNMQRKSWKTAEDAFTKAIHYTPNVVNNYAYRAMVRVNLNRLRGAMNDYDKAIDMDPNNFLAHYNRGLLRQNLGDDNRAIQDFNFVLRLEPDNLLALYNRAILLDKTGSYKEAIRDYTRVIGKFPNFWTGLLARAKCYRRLGMTAKAELDEFRVFKAQMDKHLGVQQRWSKAKLRQVRKMSDVDVEKYDRWVVLDDDVSTPQYKNEYRGNVQNRKVDIELMPMFAISYYPYKNGIKEYNLTDNSIDEFNVSNKPLSVFYLSCHQAKLDAKESKKLFALIDTLSARISSTHIIDKACDYLLQRAVAQSVVHDYNDAINDLSDYVAIDSTSMLGYWQRGVCLALMMSYTSGVGNMDNQIILHKAIEDFKKALELDADNSIILYNLGSLYASVNDYAQAIPYYNRAIQKNASFAEAYYNRGLTRIFDNDKEGGLSDLSKAGELGLYNAYAVMKHFQENK